jgi:hypothetical protein
LPGSSAWLVAVNVATAGGVPPSASFPSGSFGLQLAPPQHRATCNEQQWTKDRYPPAAELSSAVTELIHREAGVADSTEIEHQRDTVNTERNPDYRSRVADRNQAQGSKPKPTGKHENEDPPRLPLGLDRALALIDRSLRQRSKGSPSRPAAAAAGGRSPASISCPRWAYGKKPPQKPAMFFWRSFISAFSFAASLLSGPTSGGRVSLRNAATVNTTTTATAMRPSTIEGKAYSRLPHD